MGSPQWRRIANERLLKYRTAVLILKKEKKAYRAARRRQKATQEALKIAQTIAESIQRDAHAHIAGIVTRCMVAVFEEDAYEFKLIHEQKRNRTEVRMVFTRDGEELDPMDETGGGVVDVAAFALRIAVLRMQHPAPRPVFIADEPFRFVSEEYRPKVRLLLEMLAKELKMQFIIVTHMPELASGTIVEI